MKAVRRVALYVALPLALVAAVGYGWYRLSDTGRGWRYEDKLATYCDGLIPYEESAALTGLDTESGLPLDSRRGTPGLPSHYCRVADLSLTIGRIPGGTANPRDGLSDVFDELDPAGEDLLPMPLGGGWHGYTDMQSTVVVLACDNKDASVVVSALAGEPHTTRRQAREAAELVTATAENAADHWSCDADSGGRVPLPPKPAGQTSPSRAGGTCRGLPLRDADEVHWIKETKASGTAPLETCVLGETIARSEALYYLEAAFGPYAQRLRSPEPEPGALNRETGIRRDAAWASAACPGHSAQALFTIRSTEYAYPEGDFLRRALNAFAERAAKRHGCTDLKLPE